MSAKLFGDGGDALLGRDGHRLAGGAGGFAEDQPQAGAMEAGLAADGAGELDEFEAGRAERGFQDAAGLVEQIEEALRGQHGVHVARDGRFDFVEVVVGQRLVNREFYRGAGRVWRQVGCAWSLIRAGLQV